MGESSSADCPPPLNIPMKGPDVDFDGLAFGNSIENLKCAICNNYLSHFPVYIALDKHNICNRCYNTVAEKSKCVQNEAFESLAQFIQFPCRYKNEGCFEKLLPVHIPNHEELCPYRIIKCPTAEFSKCSWEGGLPTALHHCQDKHFDIMLNNGEFEIDFSHSHQGEKLFEYDSTLFITSMNFFAINTCLEFSIFNTVSDTNKKFYDCEVTFKCGNRNLVMKCGTTAFNEKNVTEIFLNSLKDRNNDISIVSGKINLEKANEQDQISIDEKINDEFLAQLTCATCGDYALPPIYQDFNKPEDKQIICLECYYNHGFNRASGSGIFVDQTSLKASRNVNLDKIANRLNYPCKHRRNGCTVKHKPEEMKAHTMFCPFATHACPFSEYNACKWTGLGRDIESHIETNHQTMIKSNSVEISESVFSNFTNTSKNNTAQGLFSGTSKSKNIDIRCYVIRFAGHLFQLKFSEVDHNCYWTVQKIGQLQDKFMYELEILDKNGTNQRLVFRLPCTAFQKKDRLFTVKNSYCYLQKNQIEPFICGQLLTFKISIFK